MTLFSVIIITKDRAEDLETKALPSLLEQKNFDGTPFSNFEILLWDGSTTDETQQLAQRWAPKFTKLRARLVCSQAPRLGTAKQRNDALSTASAPYIAFFDDDSVVSPDGLAALADGFTRYPELLGLSLRLTDDKGHVESPALSQRLLRPLPHGRLTHRRMKPLGGLAGPHEIPGLAYTLPANAMALRRKAFDLLTFDERLQQFSNYAFGEDRLLSAGLFKLTGKPFMILDKGWVWHKENPAPRAVDKGQSCAMATQIFNRWLIWRLLTNHPILLKIPFWISCYFRYKKFAKKMSPQDARLGFKKAREHISRLKQKPLLLQGESS